jgi:hypothetical protein
MFLVQILWPLYAPAGHPFPHEYLEAVHDTLMQRYGGVTAYTRAPAAGVWKADAHRTVRDDIIVLEVMVETLSTDWWAEFKHQWQARLGQEYLVVRAQEIQLL